MPADRSGAARTVDLRPLEEPPFDAVVDALGEFPPDEEVVIVAGFAPVPLYDALDARGVDYEAVRVGPDEWHVRIRADDDAPDRRRRSRERPRRPRSPCP